MFFDNNNYFEYVRLCREAGITIPIIPGIKVLKIITQLVSIPKNFYIDLPDQLVDAITKDPKNVAAIGKEWACNQVEDLLNKGAPCVHFYIMNDTKTIVDIVKKFQK
jgi:methylenetetrahydrofolate reductase (NADPH)